MTYEYDRSFGAVVEEYWPQGPRIVEVYGTMPEAQSFVAEEFNLPLLPPTYAISPPPNPRTEPYRRMTIIPVKPALGFRWSDLVNHKKLKNIRLMW